jgi:hypothetical protein
MPRTTLQQSADYRAELFLLAIGLVAMNLVFVAEAFREGTTVDREAAGQLGDFVGGYVGTLFGLASVVCLFMTLRLQRQANEVQAFSQRFYALLSLHRDNVAAMAVRDRTGRDVFVLLLNEWRTIAAVVRDVAVRKQRTTWRLDVIQISYYFLYYGVGRHSGRMVSGVLSPAQLELAGEVADRLSDGASVHREKSERLEYVPFQGHQSRLGHYYRHLYQFVGFVHNDSATPDQYEYVRTIRAQLSTYEQALLLLNSLTPLGYVWWTDGFMLKYRMVKNLPRDFFDPKSEMDVALLFPQGFFEWQKTDTTVPPYLTPASRGLTVA